MVAGAIQDQIVVEDEHGWKTTYTLDKFIDPDGEIEKMLRAGAKVEDVREHMAGLHIGTEVFKKNLALNEGLQELIQLLIGAGGTAFSNANSYIGVGDSATAAAATDTGLIATTNELYKVMDATYPTTTGQTVSWRATFGSGDANFAWNEYTVANGNSDAAKNLNRKVESKGTKASGETWTLQIDITLS